MKKISILTCLLLTVLMVHAAADVTTSGDTLVITLKQTGDIAATNFTGEQLQATNIKVVSQPNGKLNRADAEALLGTAWGNSKFLKIKNLNLALASFVNQNDMQLIGYNSKFFNGGNDLGTLVLPEEMGTTPFAFYNNCKWTTIIFPDATKDANKAGTKIASSAFSGDTYLKRLVIGSSVQSIATQAFLNCSNLANVEFLYGIQRVDNQAFYGCTALTTVTLPESLTEIGVGAFQACSMLSTLRLPNSLKYIRSQAFNQTALSTVVIPAGVLLIENNAFGAIKPLTDVYVLGTQTQAALQAFQPSNYTYGYKLNGHKDGDIVSLTDFSANDAGNHVVLHYPKEAYANYVNDYLQLIGTADYAKQSKYQWDDNHWVFDADGHKYPISDYGYFSNPGGDYAGWKEFMLTNEIKSGEVYQDINLSEGKWYSVCYPFNLNQKQIENAFGASTLVCEFSAANLVQYAGQEYLSLDFSTPVKNMKAHHPYMIHPGKQGTDVNVIVGVVVDKDDANDNYQAKLKAEAVTKTDSKNRSYTFIGNHTAGVYAPKFSYYYYSGDDTRWSNAFYKAMRNDVVFTPHTAVVEQVTDNGIGGSAKTYYFTDTDDNATTGIVNIPSEPTATNNNTVANGKIFNIYGQVVRSGNTGLQGLPSGLYIVNGKKYVVK